MATTDSGKNKGMFANPSVMFDSLWPPWTVVYGFFTVWATQEATREEGHV